MKLSELPIATWDDITELLEDNTWVMVFVYHKDQELKLGQSLVNGSPSEENYTWFRLPDTDPNASEVLDNLAVEQCPAFVITSLYRGEPETWVFDEFEERFPEDLIQFMDDHAGEIELEDEDF